MRPRLLPLALLFACAGGERADAPAGEHGGTLVIAMPAEPTIFLPPKITGTHEKQVADQVFDYLAEIGPGLNTWGDGGFTPRLATSWEWGADSLSIAFHLDPRARWHDGRPVTAADVRFSLALYKDPAVRSALATPLGIVDSIAVRDSLTAVAWFSRRAPEQFYALAHNLAILPEHHLDTADRARLDTTAFARHPIGSGPFRFVRWEPRSVVEVAADTAYHLGRPHLDRIIWTLGGDLGTAVTKVVTGEADLLETLTPDHFAQVAASQVARPVRFTGLSYGYLGFNFRHPDDPARPHPLLADRGLRTALAMAIDRRAMLANVYDTLAWLAAGPFTRAIATADTTVPHVPFDSAGADRMLDSLGWRDTDGDGVRDRDGRPLRLGILVAATSLTRRQYAELIQAVLRPHGVRVDVDAVAIQVYGPRAFEGRFDAILNAWQVDPSPAAIRGSWRSKPSPAQPGPNFQSYASPAFDATLDSATAEMDAAQARALFGRAYRALAADAPAVWLYETRAFVAVHRRIRTAGEDADTWWRFLRLWWIPAGERIDRDVTSVPEPDGPDTSEARK